MRYYWISVYFRVTSNTNNCLKNLILILSSLFLQLLYFFICLKAHKIREFMMSYPKYVEPVVGSFQAFLPVLYVSAQKNTAYLFSNFDLNTRHAKSGFIWKLYQVFKRLLVTWLVRQSKKQILKVPFLNAVQNPNIRQSDIISQLRYFTCPVFG